MKKIIFTVATVVALVGSSFAQKATTDNPWSLEGVINYSGAGGVDWKAPTVRARYFVNDNIAVRAQLGLGDPLNPNTAMSESHRFYGLIYRLGPRIPAAQARFERGVRFSQAPRAGRQIDRSILPTGAVFLRDIVIVGLGPCVSQRG